MPRSKTGAGPRLNRTFFTSQKINNNLRLWQNLVLKVDWTGANFSKNNPRPGQHQGCTEHFSLSKK